MLHKNEWMKRNKWIPVQQFNFQISSHNFDIPKRCSLHLECASRLDSYDTHVVIFSYLTMTLLIGLLLMHINVVIEMDVKLVMFSTQFRWFTFSSIMIIASALRIFHILYTCFLVCGLLGTYFRYRLLNIYICCLPLICLKCGKGQLSGFSRTTWKLAGSKYPTVGKWGIKCISSKNTKWQKKSNNVIFKQNFRKIFWVNYS